MSKRKASKAAQAVDTAWFSDWMKQSSQHRENGRTSLINELKDELKREAVSNEDSDLLRLTLEYLGVMQLPQIGPYANPKSVKKAKIEALTANLQRVTRHLHRLADGDDREAIELLAGHTLNCSRWLSKTRRENPKSLMPVAKKNIYWPVLKSPCIYFDDVGKLDADHQKLLDDLKVGEDHPVRGQKWRPINPLSQLVSTLFEEALNKRASYFAGILPPLSLTDKKLFALPEFLAIDAKIVDEWADVILLLLREKYPDEKALVKAHGGIVTAPTKRVGIGTIASQLRANIKRRFQSMAGHRKT